MRLIDADELKKAFEDTVCIEPMPYAFVKQIIDNAPTVEIPNYGGQIVPDVLKGWRYEERPQGDLIKAFELLKAYCKNRECNKDCVFYRELRVGDNTEQFCGLCEIVMSDDKENKNETD